LLLDLSPLRRHRDFRALFIGQWLHLAGRYAAVVLFGLQVYELREAADFSLDTLALAPMVVTSLFGGALADTVDRRLLLLGAQGLLLLDSLALTMNALSPQPSPTLIFWAAGLAAAVAGFHAPVHETMTQRLVDFDELPAAAGLNALCGITASVGGVALAAHSVHVFGVPLTFALIAAVYSASLIAFAIIRPAPATKDAAPTGFSSIAGGLDYVLSHPRFIATYAVHLITTAIAVPYAVFTLLASQWTSDIQRQSQLSVATSAGALIILLFSRWTAKVKRQGAAMTIAAAIGGAAIAAMGFAHSLPAGLVILAIAGAAETVSDLFRQIFWNETVPSKLRGRVAGLAQFVGLGGALVSKPFVLVMTNGFGPARSVTLTGLLCASGILICIPVFPGLWRYRKSMAPPNWPS
jgi:MFS family permease